MKNLNHRVKTNKAKKIDDHYYSMHTMSPKFNEYIDDPDMDGNVPNKDIMMHTVIDTGNNDFESQLKPHCKNKNKNSLYAFKIDDQLYPIKFSDALIDQDCFTFSGVEWIITYYKPENSKNIILSNFFNSIILLKEHLSKLTTIDNSNFLYLNENNNYVKYENNKINQVYVLPDTTLVYYNNSSYDVPNYDINKDLKIVVQMTFSCDISYAFRLMKKLLAIEYSSKQADVLKMYIQKMPGNKNIQKLVEMVEQITKNDYYDVYAIDSSIEIIKMFIYNFFKSTFEWLGFF
jgi:hypothetical protein